MPNPNPIDAVIERAEKLLDSMSSCSLSQRSEVFNYSVNLRSAIAAYKSAPQVEEYPPGTVVFVPDWINGTHIPFGSDGAFVLGHFGEVPRYRRILIPPAPVVEKEATTREKVEQMGKCDSAWGGQAIAILAGAIDQLRAEVRGKG